jgi:CheY-like chemotaxis protein
MKPNILVIDDEEEYHTILHDMLGDNEYAVTTTPDGMAGLACARQERFDLIVTDMIMPNLHGPELIAMLRIAGCTTPIIAISGYPDRGVYGQKTGALDQKVTFNTNQKNHGRKNL